MFTTHAYIQCRKTTKQILLRKIKTLDPPLYLIPLMNFRNCSKAGLNSPIYMTNPVRWFCCFTEIHTSLSPPFTHNASPQSGHPAQPGHQICLQPWIYWDTCLNCSVLCASVRKKEKISQEKRSKQKQVVVFGNVRNVLENDM